MGTYMYSGFDPLACQVLCWPVIAKRGRYGQYPIGAFGPLKDKRQAPKRYVQSPARKRFRGQALPPTWPRDLSSFFTQAYFRPRRFSACFFIPFYKKTVPNWMPKLINWPLLATSIMGEVALKYRLMPESPDSDIEAIVSEIPGVLPEDAKFGAHEIKPFAFGLKAIMIAIIGIDRDGFATEVEDGLNSLKDVQTVILEEQSLI